MDRKDERLLKAVANHVATPPRPPDVVAELKLPAWAQPPKHDAEDLPELPSPTPEPELVVDPRQESSWRVVAWVAAAGIAAAAGGAAAWWWA